MVKNQFKPLLMRSLEPKKGAQAHIAISGKTRNEVSFSQQEYYNFLSPLKMLWEQSFKTGCGRVYC